MSKRGSKPLMGTQGGKDPRRRTRPEPPAPNSAKALALAVATLGASAGTKALTVEANRIDASSSEVDVRRALGWADQFAAELAVITPLEAVLAAIRIFGEEFDADGPLAETQLLVARKQLMAQRLPRLHDHVEATAKVAKLEAAAETALGLVKPVIEEFGRYVLQLLSTDARVPKTVVGDIERRIRAKGREMVVRVATSKDPA